MIAPILRGLLAVALAAGLLPLAAQQDPGAEKPSDVEKGLRAEFKKAMVSKDAGVRTAAVASYDEGTRLLGELAAERLVARTLAEALGDDDPAVAMAAVSALSWGRDPATVIESFDAALEDWRTLMGGLATRPDEASRDRYRGASGAYRAGALALARYADDRAVKVLEDELRVLRPGGTLENVASNLLESLSLALLDLGSRRAVETVVKATASFPAEGFGGTSDIERSRLGMANSIHEALAAFSLQHEIPAPEFSQNYQQDWSHWFKEHQDRFPAKLGKLAVPPGRPEEQRGGARDEGRPGRRERP